MNNHVSWDRATRGYLETGELGFWALCVQNLSRDIGVYDFHRFGDCTWQGGEMLLRWDGNGQTSVDELVFLRVGATDVPSIWALMVARRRAAVKRVGYVNLAVDALQRATSRQYLGPLAVKYVVLQ
jgi:hypothetical protein